MKITKEQAVIMLNKMPEIANEIYLDYPELKPLKVVDSWEQLGKIGGCYIQYNSHIDSSRTSVNTSIGNRNVFKTEKQTQSALAYAQLTQLMHNCGDCDVDWSRGKEKHTIWRHKNALITQVASYIFSFLAFNTAKIRDEFMQKHEGLIKQFYQL